LGKVGPCLIEIENIIYQYKQQDRSLEISFGSLYFGEHITKDLTHASTVFIGFKSPSLPGEEEALSEVKRGDEANE
jgi:hypothetical protein